MSERSDELKPSKASGQEHAYQQNAAIG